MQSANTYAFKIILHKTRGFRSYCPRGEFESSLASLRHRGAYGASWSECCAHRCLKRHRPCSAIAFARSGCSLLLTGFECDELTALHTYLTAEMGATVASLPADLTLASDRQNFLDWVRSKGQSPDILVNNAGLGISAGSPQPGKKILSGLSSSIRTCRFF